LSGTHRVADEFPFVLTLHTWASRPASGRNREERDEPPALRWNGRDEGTKEVTAMDYKLELVLIPVSDVDRAKAFYAETAGFRLDVDHHAGEEFRVVQLTPPGSACSIAFGIGVIDNTSAPVRGLHLVVTDIEAARADLSGRGVEVSEIRHMDGGWKPDVDPNHANYNSFADFADPDGNTWVLQEVGWSEAEA
jgi:catechol 2,3-dioxygenase-like lactoylglutathione lyase family enzyme